MHRLRSIATALVFASLAACGGGQPTPPTPPSAPSAPTPPAASAPATPATPATGEAPATPPATPEKTSVPAVWSADMPKNQQIEFMKQYVMPKMQPVFAEHDGKRYGEFTCKTCHGPKFLPPKEFLPHLTLKDGKITAFTDKPEISKWMAEKVTPQMATAMGQKPYDPKTHQGFGCAGCHAVDMK